MERAALSRRPPGFSGAGALTMEQAKISSARGTPAAQPTRAPAPVVADADDGTPATGFAAWLAGLAGVAGGGGEGVLGQGWRRWLPGRMARRQSRGPARTAARRAWQRPTRPTAGAMRWRGRARGGGEAAARRAWRRPTRPAAGAMR